MDIQYILILFLVIIFFLYGLILSEVIDYVFPDIDNDLPDYRLGIEIFGELIIAYLILYIFKKYIDTFIKKLFKIINKKIPFYLNQLLIISFSFGIYKHLQKSTRKVNYFKEKFIKWP
jgi:hypothetical protein